MPNPKDSVLALLFDDPIELDIELVKFCRFNPMIAIFLQECMMADGELRRSRKQWEARYCLTKGKLTEARSLLEPHGIVESWVEQPGAGSNIMVFRVNWEKLEQALKAFRETGKPLERLVSSKDWRKS